VAKVLLVEDSPMQAEEIRGFLSDYGVEVVWAEDGQAGLQAVNEQMPDLIVLDLNLPIINGHQLCRRIKRDPNTSHIPVILLTASDNSDEMIKGMESGADDYVPKDQLAAATLITVLQSMGLLEAD
jgi:twitching motility two-component system response regulator PilH